MGTRVCRKCGREQDSSEFRGKQRGKVCNSCVAAYRLEWKKKHRASLTGAKRDALLRAERVRAKKYRKANPEGYREYHREYRTKMLAKIQLALIECLDCGEDDLRVLLFHHRNPDEKRGTVLQIATSESWDAVEMEIEKCDVLCANCHMKRHYFIGQDGTRRGLR